MSILIGAGIGLLIGICSCISNRDVPAPYQYQRWRVLYLSPLGGAFVGLMIFMLIKV